MKIKCVEMVRNIRDQMAEQCGGMSPAEVVEHIHRKAERSRLWKKLRRSGSKP